ncbi:hypothetical protein FRC02_005757, partial [Tulasnella sp. 418]
WLQKPLRQLWPTYTTLAASAVHSYLVFFAIISNLHTQKPFHSVVDGFATGAIPTTTNVTKVMASRPMLGKSTVFAKIKSRWLPNMMSRLPWSNQQDRVKQQH